MDILNDHGCTDDFVEALVAAHERNQAELAALAQVSMQESVEVERIQAA
jgi:hypothetical protein